MRESIRPLSELEQRILHTISVKFTGGGVPWDNVKAAVTGNGSNGDYDDNLIEAAIALKNRGFLWFSDATGGIVDTLDRRTKVWTKKSAV